MIFSGKKPPNGPMPDLANLTVSEARVGDVLSVAGAAPDFSDLDFTVDRRDEYEAGSQRWFEVSGSWRNLRVFLEVHKSDTTELLGNLDGRTLTLDEIGVSEDDLAQMDRRQNPADFFDYNGKFWMYRFSREVGVFRAGNATGRGFYCWQFQEQDNKRFLSVRKYEGEPFAAAIWTRIEPSDVTVYRGM